MLLGAIGLIFGEVPRTGALEGALGDYGDAPDRLLAGYVLTNPQLYAHFPSLFKNGSHKERIDYVLHRFPQERVYLGEGVTLERNALTVDGDFDDGWLPVSLPVCRLVRLRVFITVPPTASEGRIYLNGLFDWDHNGVWAGASLCPQADRSPKVAVEWAIRNLPLHEEPYGLKPGFQGEVGLPPILSGPVAGELWVRLTISTEPVDEDVFVPAEHGGLGWDGSGEFLYGETEDYLTCLLPDPKAPPIGCPQPLSDQPPTPEVTNAPPIALGDEAVTPQGTPVTVPVLNNDFDPEGAPLTVVGFSQGEHGTVSLNLDGTLTYTPDPDFSGEDTFTYTVCDPEGLCSTGTVTVSVRAETVGNMPPLAVDDAVSTEEDLPLAIEVLANDSDPDGDSLAITSFTQPANGSVSCTGAECAYTPNDNFYGTDSFTYTIDDGQGGRDSATVVITVEAVNDPPVSLNDSVTTSEDVPVEVEVLANDSDPEGKLDPGSLSVTNALQHGNVTVHPDGILTYEPDPDFHGTDHFTYEVCDADGLCSSALVTIDVLAVNDPPAAQDDSAATDEDTSVVIAVTANDSDPDGNLDMGSLMIAANPSKGTAVAQPDGTILYTPDPDFHGVDSFSYQVCDTEGLCGTATVTVTVAPVNDPPILSSVSDQSVSEGSTLTVLFTCTDIDGDALALTAGHLPEGASFRDRGDGTATLTYSPGFDTVAHPDTSVLLGSVEVTCSDGGASASQSFDITVLDVNRPPLAQDDAYMTDEDTPLRVEAASGLLADDSDPDGDPISVISFPSQSAQGGAVAVSPDGSFRYTPPADFYGTDSFTYTLADGSGETSTATVTLAVHPVNDPPVALDDTASTKEDLPVRIYVLVNDSDPEDELNPSSIAILRAPTNGTATPNPDGTITYAPATDFAGTDSFDYQVCDDQDLCATATVTVEVGRVNDPAVLAAVPDQDVSEGGSLVVEFVCTDPDGDALTYRALSLPEGASFLDHGDGTATLTYSPGFDVVAHPSPSRVFRDVHISCSDGATVSDQTFDITVWDVNRPPVLTLLGDLSLAEGDSRTLSAFASCSDPDGDPVTLTALGLPGFAALSDGSLTLHPGFEDAGTYANNEITCSDGNLSDTKGFTITVAETNRPPVALDQSLSTLEDTPVEITLSCSDPDGDPLTFRLIEPPQQGTLSGTPPNLVYTPDPDFFDSDRLTFQCSDGTLESDPASVSIAVGSVNDPPVADSQSLTVEEDTPLNLTLSCSDIEGDSLHFSLVSDPEHGTLSGTLPHVVYTPDENFSGADGFTFRCSDGELESNVATVEITVSPVNDRPKLQGISNQRVNEGETLAVDLSCTDADTGDALTLSAEALPPGATLSDHGDGSGTLTYTPGFDVVVHPESSTVFSNVQIRCSDGTESVTQAFSITVLDVNRPPSAQEDSVATAEDASVTIVVVDNDSDPDGEDALVITTNTPPAHGTASCNSSRCTYTPEPDFYGRDSFTYTISDGQGGAATATVTITVEGVNDPPIPQDDSITTQEDSPVTTPVLANDEDADGDALAIVSFTQPDHGTVSCTATACTYTPALNFHGTDSYTYTVSDGQGGTGTATVVVSVSAVNDPPTAGDDAASTDEDTPITVDALGNDSDPDGDPLSLSGVTVPPSHGTVTINSDNTITYEPESNYSGSDSFRYQVCDPQGACDTALVVLTVYGVNDPPLPQDDAYTAAEDTPLQVAAPGVLGNDADPEGNGLTALLVSGPAHGSLALDENGSFVYTPEENFYGTDGFQYQACDPSGACRTASVTITVNGVNDPPIAEANGPYTCQEDQTIAVSGAGSFDPDGSLTQYEWDLDGDGTFETSGISASFPCGSAGTYTIKLRVTDDGGASATDLATVTVEEAEDPLCDDDPDRDTDLEVEWDKPSVSGSTATVNLSVTNHGDDDYALNLVVWIEVLKGEDKIQASNPALPFDWSVGNLAPAATATLTVTIHSSGKKGKVKLQATVINEECRPGHTEGKQDTVEIKFEGKKEKSGRRPGPPLGAILWALTPLLGGGTIVISRQVMRLLMRDGR